MSSEILGLTEILGEDGEVQLVTGEDVVGAARRMVKSASGTQVRNKGPSDPRTLALGFDSTATVAAAATQAVVSSPQRLFRPTRIAVPATVAPNFLINSLFIGTNNQFLNATGVHAETLSTSSQDVYMKMDTAQINSVISMSVTNLSLVATRFFATLFGDALA